MVAVTLKSKLVVDFLRESISIHLNDDKKFKFDLDALSAELFQLRGIIYIDNSKLCSIKLLNKLNPVLNITSIRLLIIYFFLSRLLDLELRDTNGRISFKKSIYSKYLDEHPFICDKLLLESGYKFKNKQSQLILTCDLDWPFFYPNNLNGLIRKLYHIFTNKFKGDIFDNILSLANIGRENKLGWLFFLLPKGKDINDSKSFEFKRIKKRLNKILDNTTNIQIGYHIPISIVKTKKLNYPKLDLIRKYFTVKIIRSHFLSWTTSMDLISKKQGFKTDYSDGYYDKTSTFSGFSRPYLSWYAFEKNLRIFKQPTHFMDIHLINNYNCLDDLKQVIEVFKKFNSDFVIIWHNNNAFYKHKSSNKILLQEIIDLWNQK